MAYAGALFADACLRGLDGEANVEEYSYVASDKTELPFFSTKVTLGPKGNPPLPHPRRLRSGADRNSPHEVVCMVVMDLQRIAMRVDFTWYECEQRHSKEVSKVIVETFSNHGKPPCSSDSWPVVPAALAGRCRQNTRTTTSIAGWRSGTCSRQHCVLVTLFMSQICKVHHNKQNFLSFLL